MLNFLRKNAQSVIIQVVVVVIAVVFVFWGVGTKLGDNPNALAVVNGKEITYREFQQSYERAVETYKQQFGGQLPQGFLEKMGLKEQVLNQLIQSELLRQGAEEIGVQISKEAVQQKIQSMEAFNTNGRFDLSNYKAILERNRLTPTSFENQIQSDLLLDRVVDVVGSFAGISEKEVQNWIDYIDQELKFSYLVYKSDDYVAKVKVNDDALQAWYATSKQNYKLQPQDKLEYLFYPYEDDLKQVAVSEEMVQKYYQENIEKYHTFEQRRARHILFRVTSNAEESVRKAKRSLAEKVLAQVKNGADFSLLARQFSEDSSKEDGGDLGYFSRGKMVQPFDDAVFSLNKGEISGIVSTSFGYHIIKLEDILPEKIESLETVKGMISKELEQQGVRAITFKKVSTAYEDIIRAGSLAKFSAKSGVTIKQTDFFAQNNPPQDKVVRDPAFLQAAFGLRKGELSSIVETANGYAIIFVKDVKPAVVPELASVREQAITDFKKIQSVDLARTAAEEILKSAREKKSWPNGVEPKESGYMKRMEPSDAVPDQVRQDAFSRIGKEVFPEKVVAVDSNFYIYQIGDVRQSPKGFDASKRKNLEQQLLATQKNKILTDWLEQVKKQAKISTNMKMLQ
jgi:peptidyl-prolyl cis-trans isomerase D